MDRVKKKIEREGEEIDTRLNLVSSWVLTSSNARRRLTNSLRASSETRSFAIPSQSMFFDALNATSTTFFAPLISVFFSPASPRLSQLPNKWFLTLLLVLHSFIPDRREGEALVWVVRCRFQYKKKSQLLSSPMGFQWAKKHLQQNWAVLFASDLIVFDHYIRHDNFVGLSS